MDEIVFLGGAARSAALGQILADVIDRPISPVADPHHALARGTALIALARQGHMDLADIADRVVTTGTYEPDPATRGVHDAVQVQFEAAFSALEPVYEALNG
jgi:xylulokinase